MADEFRFTCSNGHSWVSSNKIRSFCPECGKSTRRVTAPSEPSDSDKTTTKARTISIKQVKKKQAPPPVKEPLNVPTRKATSKPANKPAPSARKPVTRKPASAGPLTQRKVTKTARKNPVVGRKVPRTTKQSGKTSEDSTMFSRMRKMAFGR